MQIVVDLGNTQAKVGVFEGEELIKTVVLSNQDEAPIQQLLATYEPEAAIVSSVIGYDGAISTMLSRLPVCLHMHAGLPLPIRNAYATPHTLGHDRLAAAVGGWCMFEKKNVLVIDAGTCIKYDFVAETGTYYGGAISPGIEMRFKALHEFTKQLPLVQASLPVELIGDSTQTSIQSGVLNGAVAEVDGIIQAYKELYQDVEVVLTGGDAALLAKKLKNSIFAVSFLVLKGLHQILRYNVSTSR